MTCPNTVLHQPSIVRELDDPNLTHWISRRVLATGETLPYLASSMVQSPNGRAPDRSFQGNINQSRVSVYDTLNKNRNEETKESKRKVRGLPD